MNKLKMYEKELETLNKSLELIESLQFIEKSKLLIETLNQVRNLETKIFNLKNFLA